MNRYLCFIQELTPLLKQINMVAVVIAKQTKPRHYLTKNGLGSKNKEYLQIFGVPLIVTKFKDEVATLNSLTSSAGREFEVSTQELITDFVKGELDNSGVITNLDPKKYPQPVNVSEFYCRDTFGDFKKDIEGWVRSLDNSLLQKIFDDKLFQMVQTQGAPFKPIPELEKFKMSTTQELQGMSQHKRYKTQIFNRNCRWCPVADYMSWDDFNQCSSYPFPIGIRAKDFCLPSEMQKVLVEMIRQILTFKNVDEKYRLQMQQIFSKYNINNVFDNTSCHCCKYCGCEIDMNAYSSQYKSEDNYIEICHRDPNSHFCVKNMYWGHGECNRRQGGYTETEIIEDALGLINYNPTDYSPELLLRLKDSIDKALVLHSTQSD